MTGTWDTSPTAPISPKDRFVTIYGRNPVLEALSDQHLAVDKVLLADTARGPHVGEIRAAARARGVPIQVVDAERVKKIAGNGKQDQGVCADVVAPRMRPLALAVSQGLHGPVLVLDGITTPANVGMILRTATAAGFSGIVVPRRGVASIDPLVVKASAGVAFKAPILKVATALEAVQALREAGYDPEVKKVYGLGPLPEFLNPGRKPVRELTGQQWVPAVELDDGTGISGSANIIAWAREHPAAG